MTKSCHSSKYTTGRTDLKVLGWGPRPARQYDSWTWVCTWAERGDQPQLSAPSPLWLCLLHRNKQHFFLETAYTFKEEQGMNENQYTRLNCWCRWFPLLHWEDISPRWKVRASEQLLWAFSLRTFKVLHLTWKEEVSAEIVNLRLFGLERLITCRAVKAIIKFCVLGLVTIFTYQREAYSENPVWLEHKSKTLASYISLVRI